MEKSDTNVFLMDKLTELTNLEITKSKILTVIFDKKVQEIIVQKVQSIESNLQEQAQYYGQNLKNYQENYQEILSQYQKQLKKVMDKYKELCVNVQLELQEAECNQKIAITNFKKSFDMCQIEDANIGEYTKKILACIQKKINYDIIIEECERELDKITENMEEKISPLFINASTQIALREEGVFEKIFNKIKNLFVGHAKFNTYVIEPMKIETEMVERKLPDILQGIREETIYFVAKIKQAKEETNQIFESMI